MSTHAKPSVHWVQSFDAVEGVRPSQLLLIGHDGKTATWLTYGAALRLALNIAFAPLILAYYQLLNRWAR